MLLAVMDLGSNSFKMTVAQWAPDANVRHPFRVLHKERHPIQLGGSVFASGRISDKDFREGLKALEKMQSRLHDFASPILRIVATSAIRDAANGRDFVSQARSQLGLPIEVISGAEEARLISRGLTLEYPSVQRGLLIDIGGGSTEIASFGKNWPESLRYSFRIGSVRLATRFFKQGGQRPTEEAVRAHAAAAIKIPGMPRFEKLVGSAGTIQSLGEILGGGKLPHVIKATALDRWISASFKLSPQEIVKRYKVTPSRARVLVPGAIILSEALRRLGQAELVVTGMTLRDGVLVELVDRWRDSESLILKGRGTMPSRSQLKGTDRELLKFLEDTANRFHMDHAHANHITVIALSVFDQMASQGMAVQPDDRRILMAAAYLHDIGKVISEGGHHKHSAYIIRNLKIPGFTSLDAKKAALVALFHRKEPPPKKDPLLGDVRGVHADQVRRLAAILRLSDGLDEGHSQSIRDVKLRFSKKQVLLELLQATPDSADLDYFRDKAAYFEQLFGVKVVSYVQHKRAAANA